MPFIDQYTVELILNKPLLKTTMDHLKAVMNSLLGFRLKSENDNSDIIQESIGAGYPLGPVTSVMLFLRDDLNYQELHRILEIMTQNHSGRFTLKTNGRVPFFGQPHPSFGLIESYFEVTTALGYSQLAGCLPDIVQQMAKTIAIDIVNDPKYNAAYSVGPAVFFGKVPDGNMVELKTKDALGCEITVSFPKHIVHKALTYHINTLYIFNRIKNNVKGALFPDQGYKRGGVLESVFDYVVTKPHGFGGGYEMTHLLMPGLFERVVKHGYIDYLTIGVTADIIQTGALQKGLFEMLGIMYAILYQAYHYDLEDLAPASAPAQSETAPLVKKVAQKTVEKVKAGGAVRIKKIKAPEKKRYPRPAKPRVAHKD